MVNGHDGPAKQERCTRPRVAHLVEEALGGEEGLECLARHGGGEVHRRPRARGRLRPRRHLQAQLQPQACSPFFPSN